MALQGHLSVMANHLKGQEDPVHYFFWGVYVRCAFGEHSPTSLALLAGPEVPTKEQICHRAAKSDITRTSAVATEARSKRPTQIRLATVTQDAKYETQWVYKPYPSARDRTLPGASALPCVPKRNVQHMHSAVHYTNI